MKVKREFRIDDRVLSMQHILSLLVVSEHVKNALLQLVLLQASVELEQLIVMDKLKETVSVGLIVVSFNLLVVVVYFLDRCGQRVVSFDDGFDCCPQLVNCVNNMNDVKIAV